jgi:lipopolysaccharide export system protein LptA
MDSQEQRQQGSQTARLSRHWRSPVADVDFRDGAHGQVEPAFIHGSNGVLVTSESQLGDAAVSPSRLSADQVTGAFGPGSVLTAMNGSGHTSIEETTDTGVKQTTSGDRLETHFAAPAKPVKKAVQGAESQLQSATVEGHVVLTQTPVAKSGAPPPATLRATAGRADYQGQGEWLHLTLSPRVEDGALQFSADKVDVSRASGDAFAHGNVKASWMDTAGNGQKGTTIGFGGQGPAHVVAAETQLHQATGEATFRGQARLWQQANSVSAPVIVLDRERQTLVARTTSAAEPVRVMLLTSTGATQGMNAAKSNQPSVIRVRGGDLKYSDLERKAVMRSGVLGNVVAETASATSTSNEVEVTMLPAGKTKDSSQVDHMTARGHVVLTSEGRRGTGEQLVYTGATGEYVLTGTASAPPKMSDPTRGSVTGEALIFRGHDDSVSVEGGGRKTTTQATAPR